MERAQKEQKKASFCIWGMVPTAITKIPAESVMTPKNPGRNSSSTALVAAFLTFLQI